MSLPVATNNRAAIIVLVSLLHLAIPWTAAIACLWLTLSLAGALHDPNLLAAVAIVAIACLYLVETPRPLDLNSGWGHLPMATTVIARWLGILLVLIVVAAVTDVLSPIPAIVFVVWAVTAPLAVIGARTMLRKTLSYLLAYSITTRTAVIAGYGEPSSLLANRLAANAELFLDFKGFFDDRCPQRLCMKNDERLLGGLEALPGFVRDHSIDVVFIALPIRHVKRVMALLDELYDTTASVYYIPDIFVFDLIQARAANIDGMPVVAMRETPLHGYRTIVKRATDLTLSLAMLVVVTPLLIVTSILIKLSSPGPVIFKQRRYGLDGDEIDVYKFRTMVMTDASMPVTQAVRNDPRITPIGRFLRRTSIDELPQLFNVLEGKMSLVGPRPHAVTHNEQYRKLIKGYMVRHKVLPGITGLAQVSGCRGETSRLEEMERRVAFDLDYMRHWSVMLDIRILLLTLVKAWRDDKAY